MKRLLRLEQQIGKYGEKLVASQTANATKQNQWIVKEIRTILDKTMAEHSSKPELTQHFNELFCGLDKISRPTSHQPRSSLSPEFTQEQILESFDETYFKGLASFNYTVKVLMDRRVTDVQHFSRAVAQGGTILRSWTALQRELFQLHIANKLWILGDRQGARQKLAADYPLMWKRHLSQSDLPKSPMTLLMRALIATKAISTDQLLQDSSGNWRSLYVLWKHMYPRHLDVEVEHPHILKALNHVSNVARSTGSGKPALPAVMDIVPSNGDFAHHQIRTALLGHAQSSRDKDLLDLLLASCEAEGDKVLEAGVIATKLALA